jgi:dihydrofolate synthase/folylpolyglutamate synthase
MNLQEWLTHCERLHPQNIDMGLERVAAVAKKMGLQFGCPVITVAGTNGKGSTCAMLECILREAGYRTGMFTSPHLVFFEERCKLNGQAASASVLTEHFAKVEAIRGDISLSYFEFTALAIFSCLASASLDVVILEVGLGGRLDAVNVIDTDCAIITSIDLDHTEWLGNDRESIGREKAGIMRGSKPVIISDPHPPASLAQHAATVGAMVWQSGSDFHFSGDQQQWRWYGEGRTWAGLAYPSLRGVNQLVNAAGVLAALHAMKDHLPVTAQAIRLGLSRVEWSGRFQMLPGQPAVVLDVAHNPHSVAALAHNLDAMGYFAVTRAVMGAMADKDLQAMVQRLQPLVEHWYFCDLPSPRAATAKQLQSLWQAGAPRLGQSAQTFADPVAATAQAMADANPTDRILVFGSFLTVGGVLQHGIAGRLSAQSPPD